MNRLSASRRRAYGAAAPFAVAAVAGLAWSASLEGLAVILLLAGAAYQVAAALRHRGRGTFGDQAAGAALLAGFLAVTFDGAAVVFLLPAGLAYLLVGIGLAQGTAVRERVARALRGRQLPADEPEAAWDRDRAALALVIPTCLLAMLLVPLATWTIPWPEDPPEPSRAAPVPEPRPSGSSEGLARLDGRPGVDPGTNGPDPSEEQHGAIEVTPTRNGTPAGNLGPMYLRGVSLVDSGGRWREDLANLRDIDDSDDGEPDESCSVGARPSRNDQMELAVHLEVTEIAKTGEVVVFCPPATAAVGLSHVRSKTGGPVLTRADPSAGSLDYTLVAALPSRVPLPGPADAAVRDPRALDLPAAETATAELSIAAQRIADPAETDVGRVRAVLRHLRENYRYEQPDDPLREVRTLRRFVENRRGTCVQFARSGVVMLRSLGIDARVGTGFLVTEWDDERGRYVAQPSDGHAWVEVNFERCGWVIFDPTPRPAGDSESGLTEPDFASDSPDATDDGPPPDLGPGPIERMVADVADLLDLVLEWIAAHPWRSLVLTAIAAAFAARALNRRERRLTGEHVDTPSVRGPWERLARDLARRGYRRLPSQTASEFAASVAASGGDALKPFVGLTALQQSARFGGRPLTPDDDDEIEAFRTSL